jgi:hypothetical protein
MRLLTFLPIDAPESSPTNTPTAVPLNDGTPQQQPSSDGPKPKRRRTQKQDVQKQDVKIPEWESARPQWDQELGDSQARQQMNEMAQRPWATVNRPLSAPTQPQMVMNGANGVRSIPQSNMERSNSNSIS